MNFGFGCRRPIFLVAMILIWLLLLKGNIADINWLSTLKRPFYVNLPISQATLPFKIKLSIMYIYNWKWRYFWCKRIKELSVKLNFWIISPKFDYAINLLSNIANHLHSTHNIDGRYHICLDVGIKIQIGQPDLIHNSLVA